MSVHDVDGWIVDVLTLHSGYEHLAPIIASLLTRSQTIREEEDELIHLRLMLAAEQDIGLRAEELLLQVDAVGHLLPKELAGDVKNFVQAMEPLPIPKEDPARVPS